MIWYFGADYFDAHLQLGGATQLHDTTLVFDSHVLPSVSARVVFSNLDTQDNGELFLLITARVKFTLLESRNLSLDLLPLIPEVYRRSPLLLDLIEALDDLVGAWLGKVDGLSDLLDVRSVPIEYIQHLAALIAYKMQRVDDVDIIALHEQLSNVPSWYKIKGTYESFVLMLYAQGFASSVVDLYTNEFYKLFIDEPWFVSKTEPETNPGGLVFPNYFKSPHFRIGLALTQCGLDSQGEYLWRQDLFNPIRAQVELLRPVNTVPQYAITVSPETNICGDVIIVGCNIRTRGYFSFTALPTGELFFDDGNFFDSFTQFDQGSSASTNPGFPILTKWRLGTGLDGVDPPLPMPPALVPPALQHPVLFGEIDNIQYFTDRVVITIVVPENLVQAGLSELGIYEDNGTTVHVISTFPNIDKQVGMELIFTITVLVAPCVNCPLLAAPANVVVTAI